MSEAEPLSEGQLAEVRHHFANVFQLVSALTRMRMQRAQEAETKRQLAWMLDATGVIGLIQQRQLGSNPDDLAGYLQDLAPQWRRRCTGQPIQLDLVTESTPARGHLIQPLALIANELVANALTHGFAEDRAGVIRIELRPLAGGKAELIVSDDGRGFDPAAVDQMRLGLWLIKGLAHQIRGALTTTTEDGVTTRVEFATQFEG